MSKNTLLTLLMLMLLLSFVSCSDKKSNLSKQDPVSSTTNEQGGNAPSNSKVANAPVPTKFSKVLVGKIGTYEITMNLSRDKEELIGDYGYDSKIQTSILAGSEGLTLSGKIAQDNTFILKEVEPALKDGDIKEKVTGSFTGKIVAEQRNGATLIKVNGDWENAGKSKKLNFFLTEQQFSLGEGTKIVDKELREDNKKNKYEFNALYPQFEGSQDPNVEKFNQELTTLIEKIYKEYKVTVAESYIDAGNSDVGSYNDMDYRFGLVNKELISLNFSVNDYYAGAAHPNSSAMNFNFNLKTGKKMKLEDVFLKDSNYVSKINSLCKKAASGREYEIFFNDENPKENLENWKLSPKGIVFYFGVAHVFGDVATIFIPFSELKDVIDPASPVSALVR